ncbi:hypothetical protein DAERI_060103 [Deinococcus aerius]|uniref:Uncharacterized protein n=1 Tax=Deinococcus aerius TaxID=200253 RepID=A0A2I9CVA4_9DEIO|nr:hypothetical protein [Deinococcus aerius]GBF05843.1 hypothetical protein DAERI_060103 [Deinococcus aerius]
MTQHIDIIGAAARPVRLTLTEEAREELRKAGLENPPADLVFYMQELSERQRERFTRESQSLSENDLLLTVMRRTAAPGTDERALAEMIRDMRPTQRAQFLGAYGNGGLVPDPKATAGAVARMTAEMTDRLLGQLGSGEPSPSSPATTE